MTTEWWTAARPCSSWSGSKNSSKTQPLSSSKDRYELAARTNGEHQNSSRPSNAIRRTSLSLNSRGLVEAFGCTLNRISGSHHIYTHDGVDDLINLQPDRNGKAKPYQ